MPCCTPWRSAEPILEPVPTALAHMRLAGPARGLDLVAVRSVRLRTNVEGPHSRHKVRSADITRFPYPAIGDVCGPLRVW